MNEEIVSTIKKALEQTRKNCTFKEAWIPKGWAVVKINEFAKELARKLTKLK